VPINLAVFLKFREIVDEGSVDDSVSRGGSAAEAFEIFKMAAVDFGAGGGEGLSARVAAGKTKNLMSASNEIGDEGRSDESCSSGDKDAHDFLLLSE
jgi:hypothetical protein